MKKLNFRSPLLCYFLVLSYFGFAQSASLSTDRARVAVASIPDYYGGPNLKVLHTDAGTPLRAGTAWIWEKSSQEESYSYYVSMRAKGLNSVRMILFDTWEVEAYSPSAVFTPTDWNDPVYRARQLARMERSVNYASANGMYIIINSHNKIPDYNETYANALWTYVAPYFANRTHVLYEAANEPMSGIGNNGDMDMGAAGATSSPRLQALKRTYNIIRNGAPNTHIMVLTPPGINDYATGTGMGNLAASFTQLPGAVDWTKTSVAYHLYGNDRGFGNAAVNAANLRNLHSRYPGWPSENNFPSSVSSATLGITDDWRSAQFDNDIYVNQTCEKLGIGWSMWNINGQTQLDRNWPIMYADAVAKGWTWIPDPLTPDTQAPTVPTNLVATNIASTSATLSWTASTDNSAVTGYEVFKAGVSIGTTSSANFNLVGLVCASTAGFTVKARDAAGNWSAASTPLNITTTNCSTNFVVEAETNYTTVADVGGNCTVGPSNYAATTASNGMVVGLCDIGDEIKIAVNIPVTGTYNVQVRVRSGWGGSPMHYISNNKYEYRLNDVLQNFSYVSGSVTANIDVDSYYGTVQLSGVSLNAGLNYVRVKALEAWAKVDYVSVALIADTQAPTVPTALVASTITGSGFALAWAASTDNVGVTNYEIFRNGVSIGTSATPSFNVTGLTCGTNVSMTVKARDAAGNWSAASNALNVNTTALPNAGTIAGTTTILVGVSTTFTSSGTTGGSWSSSNTAVATVNASGIVTGVATGTATITYTLTIGGCSSSTNAVVTVNNNPNITQIIVRARSVGDAGANMRIEIMDSSSPTGGTVLQSQEFTNLPTNFADYSFNVNGIINPNQIRVNFTNDGGNRDFETDYIVVNGTTYQTEAVTTYSIGAWNPTNGCSNAGYFSISTIYCSGYFHFLAACTPPNAGSIAGTTTLCAGATSALTSNGLTGGTWSSSNPTIATVNATGVVTGVAAGTATITYSFSANGCSSSTTSTVTINALPNAGSIAGTTTLCTGATSALTSNGLTGGTWTSSNTTIATVNATGVVTGVATGTINITYSVSANGCSANTSRTITINALPNAGTIAGTNSFSAGTSQTFTSNGLTGGTWTSSNTTIATVNATGVVTGVAAGTATVTYTVSANGCSTNATRAVTINAVVSNTAIVIRARGIGAAGCNITIDIMNTSAPTGGTVLQTISFTNLPTTFANYTFNATGTVSANRIRVRYTNDMANRDLEIDYITVAGVTFQTEATTTYQIGVWTNVTDGCSVGGFYTSSILQCTGYVHFMANTTSRLSVERVTIEHPEVSFGIFPNPTQDILNVKFYTKVAQQVKTQVINLSGVVLQETFQDAVAGENTIQIPTDDLLEGFLIISVTYDNKISAAKFVVKH